MSLTSWKKDDLVRLKNGDEIRLLDEPYYDDEFNAVLVVIDKYNLGFGKKIKYTTLMEDGYLVDRKNT